MIVQIAQQSTKMEPEIVDRPPRRHIDSALLPTDSMVTVPLSETHQSTIIDGETLGALSKVEDITLQTSSSVTRQSSVDIFYGPDAVRRSKETVQYGLVEEALLAKASMGGSSTMGTFSVGLDRVRSNSSSSEGSAAVNWAELEKTEEQEPRHEDSEIVSKTFGTKSIDPADNGSKLIFYWQGWTRRMTPLLLTRSLALCKSSVVEVSLGRLRYINFRRLLKTDKRIMSVFLDYRDHQ